MSGWKIKKWVLLLGGFLTIASAQNLEEITAEFCVHKEGRNWQLAPYRVHKDSAELLGARSVSSSIERLDFAMLREFLGEENRTHHEPRKHCLYRCIIDFDLLNRDFQLLPRLIKKEIPVRWEYSEIVEEHERKIIRSGKIYISGFCTDGQLEMIRQREKKNERK